MTAAACSTYEMITPSLLQRYLCVRARARARASLLLRGEDGGKGSPCAPLGARGRGARVLADSLASPAGPSFPPPAVLPERIRYPLFARVNANGYFSRPVFPRPPADPARVISRFARADSPDDDVDDAPASLFAQDASRARARVCVHTWRTQAVPCSAAPPASRVHEFRRRSLLNVPMFIQLQLRQRARRLTCTAAFGLRWTPSAEQWLSNNSPGRARALLASTAARWIVPRSSGN